jgi:hypothetical protein
VSASFILLLYFFPSSLLACPDGHALATAFYLAIAQLGRAKGGIELAALSIK